MKQLLLVLITVLSGTSMQLSDYDAYCSGIIVVGDSRVNLMQSSIEDYDYENLFFVSEAGIGYDWLVTDGESDILNTVDSNPSITNWSIVFCLGVNDVESIENYKAEYIRLSVEELSAYSIYCTAIGKVDEKLFTRTKNEDIDKFNKSLSDLSYWDIPYIDINTYIEENLQTTDGIHYHEQTNKGVLVDILSNIYNETYEENTSLLH